MLVEHIWHASLCCVAYIHLRLGQEVGGDAREKPTLVLDLSVY